MQSNNIQLEERTLKFRFWRLFRRASDWVSTSTYLPENSDTDYCAVGGREAVRTAMAHARKQIGSLDGIGVSWRYRHAM